MPVYSECKCLQPELADTLTEAVNKLKKGKLTGKSKEYNKRLAEIKGIVDSIRKTGIANKDVIEATEKNLIAAIPVDPEVKKYNDIDQWLNSCKCPEDVHFDWHKFPYGTTTTFSKGRPFTPSDKKIECITSVPADELAKMTETVKKYNKRMLDFLTQDIYYNMNAKYGSGESAWAAAAVKREMMERGVISAQEMSEWYETNNKLKKLCKESGQSVDLMHQADSTLLTIRKQLGQKTKSKSEFGFGKRQ